MEIDTPAIDIQDITNCRFILFIVEMILEYLIMCRRQELKLEFTCWPKFRKCITFRMRYEPIVK